MAAAPPSSVYYITEQDMSFKVTYTLRAARVERWIREVKEKFLDAAPIKCVGLDCEFTDAVKNVRQADLPFEQRQHATVLQLSVAYETLLVQIVHTDAVPEALREFLNDNSIVFCGAAIGNDVDKLDYYGIDIPGAIDLQREILNPTTKHLASLYDMANAYIGTNLSKKDPEIAALRWDGWADYPLDFNKIKYAALDACLGFELVRSCWQLQGYNSHVDRLNVVPHGVEEQILLFM